MKKTKITRHSNFLLFAIFLLFIFACQSPPENKPDPKISPEENTAQFTAIVQKHLDAVSHKDLIALKSTMSPSGKMQLIMPGAEILNSVDEFMDMHTEWFQDTTWSFKTKILNTEVDDNLGIAITEIIYSEPERDGQPYFNRMVVSYALEKTNGQWYIIKDHASSVEKSTDKK